MKITTTMIKFSFPISGMEIKSKDAQCFAGTFDGKEYKVWIPKTKCVILDGDYNHPENKIIIIPKWLFMKDALAMVIEDYEQFIFPVDIDDNEIANASLNNTQNTGENGR